MSREELKEKYDEGVLDDPTEIQTYRDEIYRYTGLQPPRSMAAIEEWWGNNKSVFSRRIKPSEESQAMEDNESEDGDEQ